MTTPAVTRLAAFSIPLGLSTQALGTLLFATLISVTLLVVPLGFMYVAYLISLR